ncbi:hypothetical protein MT344_07805 [Clavibacter michiganensis subsp. phaseoli]|uniref:Uncharacterized protein n=1 Tax=Clavibacter phaseoli TaxID=1734031 RepID=A0A8I0SH45_9MICO|nr:hypothetical protein [Clavibacter phaseoli]MBM7388356.1 hypothetical protein [Clavibacter michiganensis]MBF4629699.1 hypothetical protein [Clavibacter phaseoli]MCJ1711082.1 hypothetical protein [Clavibacter phaseoli]RII94486.1 hypothetical protein DZF95_03795 [Clavibacter michiganensis]RIJ54830.1 hypothetical protein DZF99_10940 [Clavibacter phaseoli]
MSSDTADGADAWSVVDAATHGSSTHRGSAQRSIWPLEPLVPSPGVAPDGPRDEARSRRAARRG